MQGEFVQFGPRGEQTGGKFYIQRPGKLRFNYDNPSPIRVIADGKNVADRQHQAQDVGSLPAVQDAAQLCCWRSVSICRPVR